MQCRCIYHLPQSYNPGTFQGVPLDSLGVDAIKIRRIIAPDHCQEAPKCFLVTPAAFLRFFVNLLQRGGVWGRLLDSRLCDTKLLLNYRSPQRSNAHWELVKQLDPRFTYRRLLKSNLGTLLSHTQFARRSTRLALSHWFTRSTNGHIPTTFTQRAYATC